MDKGANRVTSHRWPGTVIVEDVRLVTSEMIQQWSRLYLGVKEIHLWAGFPCTDLSAVKYNRCNLLGSQSSLFWEVPRISKEVKTHFGPSVAVKEVLENVASMDRSAATEITEEVGQIPYKLDCVQAVPMRRPRFCWTTEKLESLLPDVSVVPGSYFKEVIAEAEYPLTQQWLTPGFTWEGEAQGTVFPTCMKAICRQSPPPRPAGLEKCDSACQARWRDDSYRYPPYQYQDQFLITTDKSWRLLSASEKELLLGYGMNHTEVCWSASKQKQNPVGYSDARHSYLGDSFSIYSFVLLAMACCRDFVPCTPYRFLVQRMGMAPGFVAHIRSTMPLCRGLSYGSMPLQNNLSVLGMQLVNRMLLRRTNHTGSDVRIITGEVLNSKAYPRQSIASAWWKWKEGFSRRWKRKAHINVLELETILWGVKFQIERLKAADARIFQFSDSYVCLSVVGKGRSSSLQIQRVLSKINAHLLAFGLQLIMAHVESTDNPTDKGSRR
jgi:site-specific DNA-cytosine methylase